MTSSLLIAAVGLPAGAALAALPARRSTTLASVVTWATGLAFACAVVLAVLVASGTTAVATVAIGDAAQGLRADRLTVVLLLLVLGVSWIVQRFSVRSLAGDAKARRFSLIAGLLTTFAAATPAAATLLGLAVAWTATSIALCALIGLYRGYDAAEEGIRRTGVALLVGDAALWIAVLLLTAEYGQLSLASLAAAPPELSAPLAMLVGVLVLVAACARSVQVPFHHWLPATLASPTPVSALLHAGVVNAGAVLLLLLSPLLTQAPVVMWGAVAIGAVTAIVGTALMLARPDIKGQLAQSTVAQMGFMVLTCGLGLWAAAVFHLAAHGAYKATRFLGSGGAVAAITADRQSGATSHGVPLGTTLLAALIAATPLAAIAIALDLPAGSLLLLAFGAVALTQAGRSWMASVPGASGILAFGVASLLVGPAYTLVVEEFAHFIEPAIPAAQGTLPTPLVLVPLALLLAALPIITTRRSSALADRAYVWALTAGDGSRPPRSRRGRPAPTLVIEAEGSQS